MSLQHTPPSKFASSDSNIPGSVQKETEDHFLYTRKRKQPDNEDVFMQSLKHIQDKFDSQMVVWNDKITNSVTAAVNTALSGELTKITSALAEISTNMVQLNKDNIDLKKSLTEVEKSLIFATERQDKFESQVKTLEAGILHSSDSVTRVQLLESKILAMEQQARQCNVEISNVPDRRGENLITLVEGLGNAIKHPIRPSDIVAVHRVPHADQKDRRPKNIIVKFGTRMLRDEVITACRKTKIDSSKLGISGTATALYVNEHLTLNNKLLFRQCRDAARKHDFKYVWVKHGTILARKSDTSPAIAIRSPQDVTSKIT